MLAMRQVHGRGTHFVLPVLQDLVSSRLAFRTWERFEQDTLAAQSVLLRSGHGSLITCIMLIITIPRLSQWCTDWRPAHGAFTSLECMMQHSSFVLDLLTER
jgi:hypothetical protein